ncbi:MAG: hypothetical protein ACI9TV_000575 [Sulfurimonas sp.]|jgi:uncharacterized protein (TIGR02001 family)|uniref:TorF family putative porin n=1 Tax=Sulfurimonas sp. TaxID=2022749 RepID=UPI0039E6AB46
MKSIKLSIVAALLATTGVVTSVSADDLEVSANVALTSNYVWRGMTQTANSPAVQGGVDLGYKGVYAGVWGSAVDFGNGSTGGSTASSEFDIYLGYAGEVDKFSYDVGLIQFMYPGDTDSLNFAEAYLTLGYDFDVLSVSAMYALGLDTDKVANDAGNGWEPGDAWELGVSIPLPAEITLDGAYGEYDDKGTLNTTVNNFGEYYSVSLAKSFGKFDYSLAYTGMDFEVSEANGGSKDQDNLVFTVATSF